MSLAKSCDQNDIISYVHILHMTSYVIRMTSYLFRRINFKKPHHNFEPSPFQLYLLKKILTTSVCLSYLKKTTINFFQFKKRKIGFLNPFFLRIGWWYHGTLHLFHFWSQFLDWGNSIDIYKNYIFFSICSFWCYCKRLVFGEITDNWILKNIEEQSIGIN